MKKEKLKIAIIGCGRFSPFFVPLFKAHPMVEKVYVCDIKKDREENFSKKFEVDRCESFEYALESKEINAVAIFTQREKHGPMVIAALKAGKHVYSAVPCSISVDEIKEIARLVEKTRLTYSMGETAFYRPATIYCREEFEKGTFGKFVYGEAQYNHDICNMEMSFRSSGGEEWRKYAGIPPFFYPTHSTAMLLSAMPGVYAKRVVSLGFKGSPRTDIYGTDGQNLYNNPNSCESMLIELSNGGIVRVNENRCLCWHAPETYISQFMGTEGSYEFSVAHHHLARWNPEAQDEGIKTVTMKDVTDELQTAEIAKLIREDYDKAIQRIAEVAGFFDTYPNQPKGRLPKEFDGLKNGHNGTHHFLIDDFCRAYETGKLSPTNIWAVARYNIPGLMAHESAIEGGVPKDVIDLGDPPKDWEVLDYRTGE